MGGQIYGTLMRGSLAYCRFGGSAGLRPNSGKLSPPQPRYAARYSEIIMVFIHAIHFKLGYTRVILRMYCNRTSFVDQIQSIELKL